MIRSLVFTALLEQPEIRAMSASDVERLVTDGVMAFYSDQATLGGVQGVMKVYVANVTANGTCEPGVWSRYVAALRAADEISPPPLRTPSGG